MMANAPGAADPSLLQEIEAATATAIFSRYMGNTTCPGVRQHITILQAGTCFDMNLPVVQHTDCTTLQQSSAQQPSPYQAMLPGSQRAVLGGQVAAVNVLARDETLLHLSSCLTHLQLCKLLSRYMAAKPLLLTCLAA